MRLLLVLLVFSWSAARGVSREADPLHPASAAGGSVDVLMRVLAQQLSAQMGVGFVVENKPGGAFVPGTMDIVRAAPDGYTLGYGNIVSLAINRALLPKLPYDVEKDLTLVSNCVQVFNMLAVNNDLPVRSVQELGRLREEESRQAYQRLLGQRHHRAPGGELFKFMTGTDIVHVPYKGSPQAINDLMGGNIQVMFDNVPSIGPHVKAGRVRGLGVSSPKRAAQFPDLPTIAEAVPGYETNFVGRRDRAGEAAEGDCNRLVDEIESTGRARRRRALPPARHRARRRRPGGVPRAGAQGNAEVGRGGEEIRSEG
jgi:tripartite-type tricarboxylate transporter receptor subunit TctC